MTPVAAGLRTTPAKRLSHAYAIFVSRAKQLEFGGTYTQSSFLPCCTITAQPGCQPAPLAGTPILRLWCDVDRTAERLTLRH
jgi:hypothetical protein